MIKVTDSAGWHTTYFDTLEDVKKYFDCEDAETLEDVSEQVNTDGMMYYRFEEV